MPNEICTRRKAYYFKARQHLHIERGDRKHFAMHGCILPKQVKYSRAYDMYPSECTQAALPQISSMRFNLASIYIRPSCQTRIRIKIQQPGRLPAADQKRDIGIIPAMSVKHFIQRGISQNIRIVQYYRLVLIRT